MSDDVESFRSSLDDLKMNSKPQISMLTMLAEDHEQYASEIVRVIEEQIKKVPVTRKLPIMYLIDSIIKNLSATLYPQLFAQCIVPIFCGVFEEVDEKTRQSMYKLRQTWPDIIPNKQLYLLDVKVQRIDPAWPITAKAPEHGVIHVNPKFLKPKEKDERSPQFSPVHSDSSVDEAIREELYAKEKELQKLRLELELAETKAKLEQQKKQLEQQAMLKSSKKIIDREPPIKLPPASASPVTKTQQVNRDPRLNRDPPVSRDPRLQKQQERQEKERLDMEKEKIETNATPPTISKPVVDANKLGGLPSGVRNMPSDSLSSASSSSSTRMDLATLLNSFTNAAAKVAAEQAKKKTQPSQLAMTNSPEVHSQKKYDNQSKSNQPLLDLDESKNTERSTTRKPKTDSKLERKSTEGDRLKDISPKMREKKHEEKDLKKDAKNKSPHGKDREKQNSKDKEKSDSKEVDGSDGKEKERRDSKDKDRRDSKDSDHSRERRDSRERRSDADMNHHSPRRGYRGRSSPQEFRRDNYTHGRQNRARGRDRGRHNEPVIHSKDGKTDQFGRMLIRPKSRSRDRSPVSRDVEQVLSSSEKENHGGSIQVENLAEDNSTTIDAMEERSSLSDFIKDVNEKSRDSKNSSPIDEQSSKSDHTSEDVLKVEDDGMNRSEDKSHLSLKDDSIESKDTSDVEMEELKTQPSRNVSNEVLAQSDEGMTENVSEDVDMRIQQQSAEPQKGKQDSDLEVGHTEKEDAAAADHNDSGPAKMKRQYSDSDPKMDLRPYKIPKLAPKKIETKTDENEEDISKLFGEEDVDYRHQMLATPMQIPAPVPSQNLFPPAASNLKSPAQRRWSQFKESHPNDFAQDMERKRLRDAHMQSMTTSDAHDVDLRPLTSSRQRSLPLPPLDPSVPIPKELSAENQEQILQRAEQELKEGRISHGDHQEIIRQLGQVYDIQKKRQGLEERTSRTLDLRDPRLRGIRERPFPEDIDRRVHYIDESGSHRKGAPRPFPPVAGDISDESSGNSPRYRERRENYLAGFEMSPKEDFDARRMVRPGPRNDRRLEYERPRGPPHDFDGRSPREMDQHSRDYDERVPPKFRDYDIRHHRDIDRYDGMSSRDFEERHSLHDEERHGFRNEALRDSYDGYSGGSHYNQGPPAQGCPHDMRGHSIRDARRDDMRSMRHNTPPPDVPFRSPAEDTDGFRSFGSAGQQVRDPFTSQGPRHGLPQDVHDMRPNFPNSQIRPDQRMPVPAEPRPLGPVQAPAVPMNQGAIHQTGRISDPMDDPRWSAMRGLLDNEGTEELVIDGKPFELRMGTARRLRIHGNVMDVAVDLKERGIRIDGQLIYKLGEPIKEVTAVGRTVRLYYHGLPKPIWLDGQQHEMRLDAPPRNVMVDGVRRGFQIDGRDMMILVDRLEKGPYGGPPRKIRISGIDHDIAFQAPPRRILIDNKSCELKLDSKIPYVVIDGKPHGIRFDGEPRTVFINDQPFTIPVDRAEKIKIGNRPTYIAFGGPAHEIIIDGKWFEVKFDNVQKDIHLGNRHFSVRIPGPLPRVKILDELPPNFDVSQLMSSNQTLVPQPGQAGSGVTGSVPPFIHGPDSLQGPEAIHQQTKPGMDVLKQGHPAPEAVQVSSAQNSDLIQPSVQPGIESIRPNVVPPSEGILRPFGPLNSEAIRFGQTIAQMMTPPNQPMISQATPTPMLLQSNALRHPQNSLLGLQRPSLMGFPGLNQALQNPRVVQQPPPVNLIAQGLLNQVANSMVSSTLQNLPDFAAGLRALSQLSSIQQQSQSQLQPQPQLPLCPAVDDDHGAAMMTGMQGSSFVGQQKPGVMPLKGNVPIIPSVTLAQPLPTPLSMPGLPGSQGIVPPASAATAAAPVTTSASAPSATPPVDVNSLLNKLLKAGLIKEPSKTEASPTEKVPDQPLPEPTVVKTAAKTQTKVLLSEQKEDGVPDLTDFDSEKMRRVYKIVIDQLHEGVQCHTCAARFTISDHEKYRAHLDWHFRQNKMEQEMVKVAKNRKWFYSIPDWIQYEELEDTVDKSRSEIFEQMKTGDEETSGTVKTLSVRALEGKDVVKNPVASGIEGEDVCATCGDPFDQMWNEETEEWILKNTIKVDGKTYHPVCYEDAQETPTPVAAPAKNPLEAQLEDMAAANVGGKDSSDNGPVLKTEIKSEPMEITPEPIKPIVEAAVDSSFIKKEVKTEENSQQEVAQTPLSASLNKDSEAKNATTPAASGLCDDKVSSSPPHASSAEPASCQAPIMLSTIATTVVREVIPVSQEEPLSPWEMDSNPTPELSRTPSPESFTPALSASSESLSSLAQGSNMLACEEPLPPSLLPAVNLSGIGSESPSVRPTDGPLSSTNSKRNNESTENR